MTEHAGIPGSQPDFELPGQCCVYPWGISWHGGHDSARWEEIIEVSLTHFTPDPLGKAMPQGNIPKGLRETTFWHCYVTLIDGKASFDQDSIGYILRWPTRRKPGKTVRVNIRQLEHLIKEGVARARG